jgi:uncharacterized membrane protein
MTVANVPELRRMPDGFLERGAQVTRLEAFVDAAFAFAVTLLVISLDAIPGSIPALLEAMKGVPAFAASFAQIAFFWHAHAGWSKRYGLDDAASTWLSLALVFLVLVYVYPLKIVYGALFYWLSAGWFPSPVPFAHLGDLVAMFTVYGIAFATLSGCMLALYAHAWRHRDALRLEAAEAMQTRSAIAAWSWRAVVALLSLLAAALLARSRQVPVWMAGAPGMVYVLMPLSRAFAGFFGRGAHTGGART